MNRVRVIGRKSTVIPGSVFRAYPKFRKRHFADYRHKMLANQDFIAAIRRDINLVLTLPQPIC